MRRGRKREPASLQRRAFTLVELVMVVTIIGVIAAIAVPRLSNASSHASANALRATLTNVRKAVDCYFAEHSAFPGYTPGTGAPSNANFVHHLVKYTDSKGNTADSYGNPFIFGPYLRKPFPANPTNMLQTVHVKAQQADGNPADGSVGWVAVLETGDFGISAADVELEKIGVDAAEMKKLVKLSE